MHTRHVLRSILWCSYGYCFQGCARLLLRCARRVNTDFPAHAAELTADAVAACTRASMRASAFELAAGALRAPLAAGLTPAQRRRLEAVVRRRDMCVFVGYGLWAMASFMAY